MPFHVVTYPTISEEEAVVSNKKQDPHYELESAIDGATDRRTEITGAAQRTRTLSHSDRAALLELVMSTMSNLSTIRRLLT